MFTEGQKWVLVFAIFITLVGTAICAWSIFTPKKDNCAIIAETYQDCVWNATRFEKNIDTCDTVKDSLCK